MTTATSCTSPPTTGSSSASGLEWYRVESDVGMMGGTGAHEYMAPCAAGENDVALSDAGYAANIEVASATPQPVELPPALAAPEEVDTPGLTTVEQVSAELGVAAGALIKSLPVISRGPRTGALPRPWRPPAERGQAGKRARRACQAGQRRRDRERLQGARRVHRADRRGSPARGGRSSPWPPGHRHRAPIGPDFTSGGSSLAATSIPSGPTSARSNPATPAPQAP